MKKEMLVTLVTDSPTKHHADCYGVDVTGPQTSLKNARFAAERRGYVVVEALPENLGSRFNRTKAAKKARRALR